MKRRSFLATSTALTAAAMTAKSKAKEPEATKNPIAVFTKHVQGLSFAELGKRLKSINVQGVEATLRPGGQIEPENLAKELGAYVDALAASDQKILIAASNVNAANKESEAYLKQLAKFQVPYLRMAYYRYDFSKPLIPQLESFAKQAKELAALCGAHGVTALYQNHAGKNYVGAALWDLRELLSGISPKNISVAIDIRHTSLELSQSYQAGYMAVKEHVGATYVKDFVWRDGKPENVPLGEGRAKPLFSLIQKNGFVGPLSLHMEYTDHRDPTLLEKSWDLIAKDVRTLHRWLT